MVHINIGIRSTAGAAGAAAVVAAARSDQEGRQMARLVGLFPPGRLRNSVDRRRPGWVPNRRGL